MLRGLLSKIPKGVVSLENATAIYSSSIIIKRSICSTTPLWKKKMPDRPAPIDEADFTEVFLHGSGPGGQKIVSFPPFIKFSIENPQTHNLKEQNFLRSSVETHPNGYGPQGPSHPFSYAKSQNCKTNASGKD